VAFCGAGKTLSEWAGLGSPSASGCSGSKIARGLEKPLFTGLNGATQGVFRPLCRPWVHPLYIDAGRRGFADKGGVHRALKKSAFWAIFAFDTAEPRTYNPRPRCFAADVAKRCSPLKLDVKIVGGRCLTL